MDMTKDDAHKDFRNFLAQTTASPFLIEVERAEGIYIWDKSGKKYMDMIAGVAVSNIGHSNPAIKEAIIKQLDRHAHVMVYGEYIQDTQLELAKNLTSLLPDTLNCCYFVNSGTEANEGAIKLAKCQTGRSKVVACKGSYHGNSQGSMSISANESRKSAFRPLIPGTTFIEFNSTEELQKITEETAAFILEPIQGDAGVRIPDNEYMKAVRERCNETGTLLIFDEVQVGMGRSGKWFAFEHFNVVPDILVLGKALGGGMPIGAFVASGEIMHCLSENPGLGHITTFGGHPVICAAANAAIDILKSENWVENCERKGKLLEHLLADLDDIVEIRRIGLFFAIELKSPQMVQKVVEKCLDQGLIGFWFLSCPESFRLSPPLCITEKEIKEAAKIITSVIISIK